MASLHPQLWILTYEGQHLTSQEWATPETQSYLPWACPDLSEGKEERGKTSDLEKRIWGCRCRRYVQPGSAGERQPHMLQVQQAPGTGEEEEEWDGNAVE